MVLSSIAPILTLASALAAAVTATPTVHPSVHRALRAQGTVNLMVTMKDGTQSVLNTVQEAATTASASRGDRIAAMVEQLEAHAAESQAPITAMLAQESASSNATFTAKKEFWITNQVLFEGATFELVEQLSALPSVLSLEEELVLPLPDIEVGEAVNSSSTNSSLLSHGASPFAVEWGVSRVRAPDLWNMGYTGSDVVVASIDTGVRASHLALRNNYRQAYGWFDPELNSGLPYDSNGHGTHTMGTIAGAGGIGVAPGATWMSCKGCRGNGCPASDLLACAQFMTCPTDTQGQNRDCSKAPRLVSNSWGGGQGATWFAQAVQVWEWAGIIPIFSQGNAGPECGTANSPGDYPNVIGVGATDINDGLASFSSRGPSVNGVLKPDISAPGVDIRSAWSTSDNDYVVISGTSMAAPHVAGAVVLLINAFPTMHYAMVKAFMSESADRSLQAVSQTCGGSGSGEYPNNFFGYGRINALAFFKAA